MLTEMVHTYVATIVTTFVTCMKSDFVASCYDVVARIISPLAGSVLFPDAEVLDCNCMRF